MWGTGRLTLENLQRMTPRKDVESEQRPYSHSSTASYSSGGASDPSLNVPREWGRKSRRSNDWLRRRTMEEQTPKTGDVDWLDAAVEVPLPSIEDSPLSHRGSARGTPASSVRRQNDSLDMLADLEFSDELNSASLIASTPAAYTRTAFRNTALDEIRQRELDNTLEESSVYATARLEDSDRQVNPQAPQQAKSSRESLSVRRTNPQPALSLKQTWSHPAEQEIQLPKQAREITSSTVQGPPSPISLHKASHTVGTVDREVMPQVQKGPKRPDHRRVDSQDILRRLAKASSGTPSPGRVVPSTKPAASEQSRPVPAIEQQSKDAAEAIRVRFAKLQPNETTATEPASAAEKVPRPTAGQIRKYSTERQSGQLDTSPNEPIETDKATTSSKEAGPAPVVEETLISNTVPLDPKTPVVTGAWIDTPKTTRPLQAFPKASPRKSASKGSVSPQKTISTSPGKSSQQAKPEDPILPSSALAAIVSEARTSTHQYEDAFGETTINSLEDLMLPSGTAEEIGIFEVEEDTLDNLQLPPTKSTTTAGKLREQEVLQLKSMNEHLRNTQRSLRDVRQGIQRVGNQVGAESKAPISIATTVQRGAGQCDNCDKPASALWNQAKSLLYTRHDSKSRLTWLGVFSLIFLVWLVTEFTLCILYCRPVYAERMSGFGVQSEPLEPPFVLPTLLLRPVRPLWSPLWSTVVTFLHWMWGFVTFIFSSDDEGVKKRVVEAVLLQQQQQPGVFEEGDWSMMNDEVL